MLQVDGNNSKNAAWMPGFVIRFVNSSGDFTSTVDPVLQKSLFWVDFFKNCFLF